MSKLKSVPIGNGDQDYIDAIALGTSQVLAIASAGTMVTSAAFGSNTRLIRVVATGECFIAIAASPTATNSTSAFLPANRPENFVVSQGDKIAVLPGITTGSVIVTEAVMV